MSYLGNSISQQSFSPATDYFNGDGTTVAFTLSKPVASVNQIQVVVENVPQNPQFAYSVVGNTLTFTSAPPSGTANIYVYYTSPITTFVQPIVKYSFPFFNASGTNAALSLISNSFLPFYNSSGTQSNIQTGTVNV